MGFPLLQYWPIFHAICRCDILQICGMRVLSCFVNNYLYRCLLSLTFSRPFSGSWSCRNKLKPSLILPHTGLICNVIVNDCKKFFDVCFVLVSCFCLCFYLLCDNEISNCMLAYYDIALFPDYQHHPSPIKTYKLTPHLSSRKLNYFLRVF